MAELRVYLRLLLRRLWIIVLAAVVLAGVGYALHGQLTPTYDAASRILVGNYFRTPRTDIGQVQTSFQLVATYAELAKTREILEATIQANDLPLSTEELRDSFAIAAVESTSIFNIVATHPDPTVAAAIANGVADQLVNSSPTGSTQSQIDFLQFNIDTLEEQLSQVRQQLETVESEIESTNDDETLEVLRQEQGVLVSQSIELSNTIASFSSTVTNLQERNNTLEVIEYAEVPTESSLVSVVVVVGLGFILGGMLSIVAVIAAFELNPPVVDGARLRQHVNVPILGYVRRFRSGMKPGAGVVASDR